ncbi:DUF6197 family protein [Kitasatospora purpeofusca]|uniref:DUF6197 family protein n=1 Tax=Kitasatospora purpeofusca TaxID=67352 RepID=UPI003807481F
MPTVTTTVLDLDEQLLGPLLVAEVEAYLRAVAARPEPAPVLAPAAAVYRPEPGTAWHQMALAVAPTPGRTDSRSESGPWWTGYPLPAPTLTDRICGRRPVVPIAAAEHLLLMDRYIAEHGWTQGQLWDREGRVCVLGAHLQVLAHGYGTPATAWTARLLIGNALGRLGQPLRVDTWNDQPDRTQQDIHHLLRTAAA